MTGEEFDSVLDAARAGAEWAFSVLYRDHNHRLRRYLAARAPREADDLAAETWLAAARGLASFEGGETEFRSWLWTIAHRRLVQHWRDAARRPVTEAFGEDDVALPAGAGLGGDPADAVTGRMDAEEAVRRITDALSGDQAEVVLLRVLGGLEVDQVAAVTGRRPGAVRVLQHRALRRLAKQEILVEGVTP